MSRGDLISIIPVSETVPSYSNFKHESFCLMFYFFPVKPAFDLLIYVGSAFYSKALSTCFFCHLNFFFF